MPNQRAQGQKLLTLPASAEFIRTIDDNLTACGYAYRSQFIRDAIVEKLRRGGIRLPKGIELAPGRTTEPPPATGSSEQVSSSKIQAAADRIVEEETNKIRKRRTPAP